MFTSTGKDQTFGGGGMTEFSAYTLKLDRQDILRLPCSPWPPAGDEGVVLPDPFWENSGGLGMEPVGTGKGYQWGTMTTEATLEV